MKRPADGGRGLDGVARKADGYCNPATEILEATAVSSSTTGRSCARTATPPATAWCSCRFTLPMPHAKVAEGAAAQLANKMGMDPALVVHAKPMGPDFTFFVVYGRVHHLVDPARSRWSSATTRC